MMVVCDVLLLLEKYARDKIVLIDEDNACTPIGMNIATIFNNHIEDFTEI